MKAAVCTREIDVENEAIALTKLGNVYRNVLKMKLRGHEYYKQAFSLAQSLLPRNLSNFPWYQECSTAIQKYQQESFEEDGKKIFEIILFLMFI